MIIRKEDVALGFDRRPQMYRVRRGEPVLGSNLGGSIDDGTR